MLRDAVALQWPVHRVRVNKETTVGCWPIFKLLSMVHSRVATDLPARQASPNGPVNVAGAGVGGQWASQWAVPSVYSVYIVYPHSLTSVACPEFRIVARHSKSNKESLGVRTYESKWLTLIAFASTLYSRSVAHDAVLYCMREERGESKEGRRTFRA